MLYEICHADPSPLTTQRKIEDLARSRSLLPSDAVEEVEACYAEISACASDLALSSWLRGTSC